LELKAELKPPKTGALVIKPIRRGYRIPLRVNTKTPSKPHPTEDTSAIKSKSKKKYCRLGVKKL